MKRKLLLNLLVAAFVVQAQKVQKVELELPVQCGDHKTYVLTATWRGTRLK